jgi:MYND finger
MWGNTSRESTPDNLKWLHKLEVIECDGKVQYQVEDFGDYYDGDDQIVIEDINEFLDTHDPSNLDLEHFFRKDILHPVEFTLECGVRDIEKDVHINKLRRMKATFIINQVIPRIHYHPHFQSLSVTVARAVTGLLGLIVELSEVHQVRSDRVDLDKLSTYFKAKTFLSGVALQIWSGCLYEKGIPMVRDRTLPYLRQLAMLDLIDNVFNFAGAWGQIMALLEERHGDLPSIPVDKALNTSTEILRVARNSIRLQILELGDATGSTNGNTKTTAGTAPQVFRYYPKCSAYLCHSIETADLPHRYRCYDCHYYHWCSIACREYSEDIAGHHELFCSTCPEIKRKEIRAQMQDHLNIPDVAGAVERIQCHACGLPDSGSMQMNRCSQCKAVHYCSKACQAWDWQCGDHRIKCESP